MKPSHTPVWIVALILAGTCGWLAGTRRSLPASNDAPTASSTSNSKTTRRVLYYQSSMHPWIKSPQPGKCTICGMDLVPVFEGDTPLDASSDLITLSSNSVTVIHVDHARVSRSTLTRSLRVIGRFDDNDARHRFISAYVAGRVERLNINFTGAEVVAGEPLAQFYSPTLLTAQREFLALQKSSAPSKVDHSLLAAARSRLVQMGLTEKQIEALAKQPSTALTTEILAPTDGTVVNRFVYEGQYVMEGEKLFEIADFSTMWFKFDVYEQDLPLITPGQLVEILAPALPGRKFWGKISFIDPNLNESARTAKARVEVPNPIVSSSGYSRRELLHRLQADGIIRIEWPDVLTIPKRAILNTGGDPVVYVDKSGNTFEQRRVKLGRRGDDAWEVLSGVEEGERVVTQGNLLIDAQAELNRSANAANPEPATPHSHSPQPGAPSSAAPPNPPGSTHASKPPPPTALSPDQINPTQSFFLTLARMGSALASDKLDDFNRETVALHTSVPAVVEKLSGVPDLKPLTDALNHDGHFGSAPDLKAARKSYFTLSQHASQLALQLRRAKSIDLADLRILQCPMTDRAFDGAPKKGLWIQSGAAVRNPYTGPDMLDCGTEVKP